MQSHRLTFPLASLLFLGGLFAWFLVSSAGARVSDPCTVTMNGVNVNSMSTPETALKVPYDGSVAVNVQSTGRITGHEVRLEFFKGVQWTASDGVDDGNSWSSNESVAKHSKYGVGMYRVTGKSFGAGGCSGSGFIRVTGKSPLTTPAGAGAAGATGLGAVLMGASAFRAGGPARRAGRDALAQLQYQQAPGTGSPPAEQQEITGYEFFLKTSKKLETCTSSILPAAFLTIAYIAMGAGGSGGPSVQGAPGSGKVPFKPLVSVTGVIGSLLAGLGTMVLAQQYALMFPTLTVAIPWLMAFAAIEILMTSFARYFAIKKALKKIAAGPAKAAESGA